MKITKQTKINASAGKVWKVFAHDFDNVYKWLSSIPNSYGKDVGQKFEGAKSSGRVCELDDKPNGIKASEHFLAYNEQAKSATLQVDILNAPAAFPFYRNHLDFSVVDDGQNKSIVNWTMRPVLFRTSRCLSWPVL